MSTPEEWPDWPEWSQHIEQVRLGRALRVLRTIRGISQEELGNRGGLHRNYVGAVERGEINPTFRTMLRFMRALEMRLSVLVREYEDSDRPRPT